ncbi:hypothetical protein KTO58_18325 [Chitinophaga pendula]|uniref:hypothetical protein n=1 Tax=Chitinophaga TaxID=79328 RepID=UPI000BAE9C30|nr:MULTISPECIES: hypothetical protein [Chitinophaga]ASZ11366.1 hypothetical protein CK934_10490 [Chitinophaga sp. MD30]UCJ05632.1 hypothetical protein KTO58_18325 [Chitinophaga pendula]
MQSFTLIRLSLLLCLSVTIGPLFGQKVVSDAKIVYKVELPPEQAQMDAMLENSTFTQYMRGNLSRIDMNLNVAHYTYLINSKEQTLVTLIDNHGDKYLIRGSKEEYEKDLKQYSGIVFKDGTQTKEIAGYKCRQAIGTTVEGKTFEVYYAIDLVPENKQYNRRFVNLKGIPLEFEIIARTGSRTRMIATKVDLFPVPISYFDVPRSGYKEMSREELEKLRG